MIKTFEAYTENIYRELFSIGSFKREYSDFINSLMMTLYKGKNWKRLETGGNFGIVNTDYSMVKAFQYLEKNSRPGNELIKDVKDFYIKVNGMKDPIWSLLNYVNTHFTAFGLIVEELNDYIRRGSFKGEKTPLDFRRNPFAELERMKKLLLAEQEPGVICANEIFFPDRNIFHKIMGSIAVTTYMGDYGECKMLENITKIGNVTDVIKSRPGQRIDTHGGVDIRFKLNGIPKTIQCKTYSVCIMEDEDYTFSNISNPGDYRVDYFSFVNKTLLMVFDANKGGISYERVGAKYKFDRSLHKFNVPL